MSLTVSAAHAIALTSDKIRTTLPVMLNRKAALGLIVLVALTGCRARMDAEAATHAAGRCAYRCVRPKRSARSSISRSSRCRRFRSATLRKRLEALEKGSVDVASAVADVTYAAFYGRLPGHSAPLQKIRGIALMNRAVVHLLIGPNVDPSNGLRGMRIVLGDPVGGNSALGERLVNSTGVSTSAIRRRVRAV